MDRLEALGEYRKSFLPELGKSMQHLNLDERIHFIAILEKCCKMAYNDESGTDYSELVENELLAKYRQRMQYFHTSKFIYYIDFDVEHFKKFCREKNLGEWEYYSPDEHRDWLTTLFYVLNTIKQNLYVADPSAFNASNSSGEADKMIESMQSLKGGSKTGLTRARQALLFYYLIKATGLKMRIDTDLSDIGRFMLMILGWETTDINNNSLYGLLKKAPLIKRKEKDNLMDLHWVKEQFEKINLEVAVDMVRKEIFAIHEGHRPD
jgi:hypothetical protein